MKEYIYTILGNRTFLWLLFFTNLLGTIYGYIWYIPQLEITKPVFLPFVPDSPTASLFFTIVLFLYLMGKRSKIMEALALITLFKYGIWAVVMNVLTWQVTGFISLQAWMLILSHAAMALQGLLYVPYYRFSAWHLILAAIWTLHNDVIDYVFMQYPIYSRLEEYILQIGYFTFWLSIVSVGIAYWLVVRGDRHLRYLKNLPS
ncbi:DUF1405 domain-containing protein [Jeotgalibacillus sp. S-D1]|uniref:DUF1405 domain-containing protein n=1 Tax=Jeotgalibacillus sp. S-D1 TaxID=2552189 RepID=UPI001059E298|nr:DUF1405 domain-containing protein [Jeotgalibacillus sp. S-D1]TDL34746.1 DUF1405 domain-containing protein [Jeotgalibacillus sp. S-D1]